MAIYRLILGNKNYSSWSLRAWLMLKFAGAEFTETTVLFGRPDMKENLRRLSPTGLVPVLEHGDLIIPDSIAIAEYLAERHPDANLWPAEAAARAVARSVSAQMHAGFVALRDQMPMNLPHVTDRVTPSPDTRADIARIQDIWRTCRRDFGAGGAFLFGQPTIADAMYAPVVARFHTYGVVVDATARAYMDAVWNHPAMAEARALAAEEPRIPEYER
ncbi:MAG: glutathione S-transferase family protein [Alphaproteobacteria bacterium]